MFLVFACNENDGLRVKEFATQATLREYLMSLVEGDPRESSEITLPEIHKSVESFENSAFSYTDSLLIYELTGTPKVVFYEFKFDAIPVIEKTKQKETSKKKKG